MLNPHLVGIAWYVREDYDRALQIMTDAAAMPETFEEWQERAREVEDQLKSRGFRVLRVALRAEAFLDWCRAREIASDADARCRFAADAAERAEAENPPIRVDLRRA